MVVDLGQSVKVPVQHPPLLQWKMGQSDCTPVLDRSRASLLVPLALELLSWHPSAESPHSYCEQISVLQIYELRMGTKKGEGWGQKRLLGSGGGEFWISARYAQGHWINPQPPHRKPLIRAGTVSFRGSGPLSWPSLKAALGGDESLLRLCGFQ